MDINYYRVLTMTDKGYFPIWVVASSIDNAKMLVMKSENCPERAIVMVEKMSNVYKPKPPYKNSNGSR